MLIYLNSMQLTILGSGSALPVPGRNPTSHLLRVENANYLIDCGEGTQFQIRKFGLSTARIKAIFISHLHGDHYLGLMGLLWSMELLGRRKPVVIIAPKGLDKLIRTHLDLANATTSFNIEIRSIDVYGNPLIYEDANIIVKAFAQNHRIPCFGFSFTEPPKERNLVKGKIEGLGLPVNKIRALKLGEDVADENGQIIRSKDVSSNPKPSKRYVYCTDTTPLALPKFAQHADLLYHEATYDKSLTEKAIARFHSTAEQAAEIAVNAKAKKLIIGHFSSRYSDSQLLLTEAQEVFSNTLAAKDGLVVEI